MLRKWLNLVNPERILEWGPGESTQMMIELCPAARIVTVQHDRKYYADTVKRFGDNEHVSVKHIPAGGRRNEYAYEGMRAVGEWSDFIFVDGRRRVECCVAAMSVLAQRATAVWLARGVILLHDADQPVYRDLLLPLIDVVDDSGRTLVFRPKACYRGNGATA